MLPSSYQTHLQSHLNDIQIMTLEILVELLQKERRVRLERLAELFPQPILFQSRRRNLQRFLDLLPLNPQTIWFPIVQDWLTQTFALEQRLSIVIDRTQWKDYNIMMVSLVYGKRAIPLHWTLLDKQGQSNLSEQQFILRPVFNLLHNYEVVLLGDREYHSVALADWCIDQGISFVLRLPKSTTVQLTDEHEFERLDALPLTPGMSIQEVNVQVTQHKGFGNFNLVLRHKRAYGGASTQEPWYLLTDLEDRDDALPCYADRFSIEPMFRDYKSGGYHLEACHADPHRLFTLILLIAIAYTTATLRGKQIRQKQVHPYVARPTETHRTRKRHSDFWLGLYGKVWLDPYDLWGTWADKLMALKPQKRSFFQRGLRAIALIQSTF
jgi:hypothetical protein